TQPTTVSSSSQTAPGCGKTYSDHATWTAADGGNCGGSTTTSATFTVQDTTAPTISCPAATTAECQSAEQANVNPGSATGSDQCGNVTVTNAQSGSYPLGKTTTMYSAKDDCGNTSGCASAVTVVDTMPPSIQCPAP